MKSEAPLNSTSPAPHRWRGALLAFACGALSALLLLALAGFGIYFFGATGRSPERHAKTGQELAAGLATETKDAADDNRSDIAHHVAALYACQQRGEKDCTIDFLLLSGGGDRGAFGAGFLLGWSSIPPGPGALPDFDGVSGVSTGALIAPFAFLGTRADYETIDRLFRNPKPDWWERRGLLFFLPENSSLADVPGLVRDLRAQVTLPMVKRIVEAATPGRVLLIQSTDLDNGTAHAFDLVAAAREAVATGDPRVVSDILLSSAAIPGAFPPVEIDGRLYADGGIASNFFYGGPMEDRDTFGATWRRTHPGAPIPKMRYWVIINEYIEPDPVTVQPTWPAIVARSLYVSVRASEAIALRHLYAIAQATTLRGDGEVEVRWVAVPQSWKPLATEHFDEATMRSLSDTGKRLGADPKAWMTEAP